MKKTLKAIGVVVLVLGAGLGAGGVLAQSAAGQTVQVDIPALPLNEALKMLGRQAGIQVVFYSKESEGLNAPKLNGKYTAQAALEQLLANTGLGFQFVNEKTVAIRAKGEKTSAMDGAATSAVSLRLAQDKEGTGQDKKVAAESEAQSGELTVIGVRDTGIVNQGVIPRQANQAVRYEILDREAIERSGASSLTELLVRQLPQASNVGTDVQRTLNVQQDQPEGITSIADTLNLRGFGSAQTLILINGRRLYGSDTSGPDISRIPLGAVERIEISPSSGSAIYGANAMAGVINIVLRRNYSGTELEGYFGAADGGAEELRLGFTQGLSFNDGRTTQTIFGEYRKVEALTLGDRDYASRVLERFPPGSPLYQTRVINVFTSERALVVRNPATLGLGIPGNPGASYALVPAGTNGTGLTPASFTATAGMADVDTSNVGRRNLLSPNESASLFTTLEHAIRGEDLAVYLEASYRWADTSVTNYQGLMGTLDLAATNGFNPFGVPIQVRAYTSDIPSSFNDAKQETFRLVGGLRGQFTALDRAFKWSIDASWDRNETESINTNYVSQLRAAVIAGQYNPLKDYTVAPMVSDTLLNSLRQVREFYAHPEIAATNWRINGELFNVGGGAASLSLGAEYRQHYMFSEAVNPVFPTPAVRDTRASTSVYAELFFPFVTARNRRPFVYALDMSAAVRYEKYEDFDAATPPMIAARWAPTQDVAFRAQFSEGFQAPTASQLSGLGQASPLPGIFLPFFGVDPLRPSPLLGFANEIIYTFGAGNPDLQPETSDTWDAGIILTPRWINGLTINLSYFRYDKINQAGFLTDQELMNAGPPFIQRGANLVGDPVGIPGPIVAITSPYVNLARQFSDGIDYNVDYQLSTGVGNFRMTAQATQTHRYIRQLNPTAPETDSVGNFSSGVLRWRGRTGLSWTRDRWSASWAARYVDAYHYQTSAGVSQVGSSLEHDLQFTYSSIGGAGWRQMLEGTKWTLGVMNIFDDEPPFVDLGSWYSTYNDPRQRFISLNVRKAF